MITLKQCSVFLICIIISFGIFSGGVIPKTGGIFFGYSDFTINNYTLSCHKCEVCTQLSDIMCTGEIIYVDCCDPSINIINDNIKCNYNLDTLYKAYNDSIAYLKNIYPLGSSSGKYYNKITIECISYNNEITLQVIGMFGLILIFGTICCCIMYPAESKIKNNDESDISLIEIGFTLEEKNVTNIKN